MATKQKQSNVSLKRVLIGVSVLLNIILLGALVYLVVMFRSGNFDLAILNYSLTAPKVNYGAPGNCLYVSSDQVGTSGGKGLDDKGRLLSQEGKVTCLVQISSAEADALQQLIDAKAAQPAQQ